MGQPFIVTGGLPPDIFSWANQLRTDHFPPERNHLRAHVTLFHSFAPSLFDELKTVLPKFVAEFRAPHARVTGVMKWKKGTAIAIDCPELLAIRGMISDHFHGSLTDQDLHEPRLHITIQNKVSIEEARDLQAQLEGNIPLRDFVFPALELHIYQGGPWEFVRDWRFRGKNAA